MIPALPRRTCCHLQTCAGEGAGGEIPPTPQIIITNMINAYQTKSSLNLLISKLHNMNVVKPGLASCLSFYKLEILELNICFITLKNVTKHILFSFFLFQQI